MRRILILAVLLLAAAAASGDEASDHAADAREHCADGCVVLSAADIAQQKEAFLALIQRAYLMGRADASEGCWNRTSR